MDINERLSLITKHTEETLTAEDLKHYIELGIPLKHYIGLEISGKIHLGTGIQCMKVVKDLIDANVETTIFLADFHTWINDKLGGDLKIIRGIGVEYFKNGLIAGLKCLGADISKVKFVMGSELYNSDPIYWSVMIDVAKNTSLSRMMRSITITGRKEGDNVDFAKLIYPAMQVADIFALGVNIVHAGMDQRKAHVVARDVATHLKIKPLVDLEGNAIKPVALHNSLIQGLSKPAVWPIPEDTDKNDLLATLKMSKSKPDSAVFVTDSPEEISSKIKKAFCEEGEVIYNPILNWVKNLVFIDNTSVFKVTRKPEFGGDKTYTNYSEVQQDFENKLLHPVDLKNAVSEYLVAFLKPARDYFEQPEMKRLKEEMDKLVITR